MRNFLFPFCLLLNTVLAAQEFPSVPEDSIPNDQPSIEKGRLLFHNHCVQCHSIFDKQIGPPLAYIYRFYDFAWLNGFITNSQKMVAEGDEFAVGIFEAYNNTIMPSHDLNKEEVWSLIAYIKKSSEVRDYNEYFNIGPEPTDKKTIEDSKWSPLIWILIGTALFTLVTTLFVVYKKNGQ